MTMRRLIASGLAAATAITLGVVATGVPPAARPAAAAVLIPPPASDATEPGASATALFAGGCFWGVEGVFEHVAGVRSAVSGYAGGTAADANYQAVGSGRTRHAEVVRVTYDPRRVSYGTLLRIFFSVVHDPTQLNRQGPDQGPQYRSAIFPQNAEQRRVADAYIRQLGRSGRFSRPIVTRLERGAFHPAEPHHQDFMRRNPNHPYIRAHDAPKLRDFRQAFPGLYADRPAA